MEYVLVTVSVTARKVPEQEMPSPLQYGAVGEADFFEKQRGTHPFTRAVALAMSEAGISTDEGCLMIFEPDDRPAGLPLLSVPIKAAR